MAVVVFLFFFFVFFVLLYRHELFTLRGTPTDFWLWRKCLLVGFNAYIPIYI